MKEVVIEIADLILQWRKTCLSTRVTRAIARGTCSPTQILTRICEKVENETEKTTESRIESEDYGRDIATINAAITLPGNSEFLEKLIGSYIFGGEDTQLRLAALRLLATVVTEGGFANITIYCDGPALVSKLFDWAREAEEPLRSYAYSLLSRAMEIDTLKEEFQTGNLQLIVQAIRELGELKSKSEEQTEEDQNLEDSGGQPSNEGEQLRTSAKQPQKGGKTKRKSQQKTPKAEEAEEESSPKKKYCLNPITTSTQQLFRLRYLTFLVSQPELRAFMLERGLMDLILYFCDYEANKDIGVTTATLQMLILLLVKGNVAREFLEKNGLEKILHAPHNTAPIQYLSILFGRSFYVDHLERICQHPRQLLTKLVSVPFAMLQVPEPNTVTNAKVTLLLDIRRPILLEIFDELDGLKSVFELAKKELPPEDESLSPMQALMSILSGSGCMDLLKKRAGAKITYLILKAYVNHHISVKAHHIRSVTATTNGEKPSQALLTHKEFEWTRRSLYENADVVHDEGVCSDNWEMVRRFKELNMIEYLLRLILRIPYTLMPNDEKCDTVTSANVMFIGLCCSYDVIQILCEPIQLTSKEQQTDLFTKNPYAIKIFIAQADGQLPPADINQKNSAFAVLTRCVCVSKAETTNETVASIKKRIRQCVRDCNGLQTLLSVLMSDTADMWWLACKALLGMVHNNKEIQDMLNKMPLFHGPMQERLKKLGKEKSREQYKDFCRYGTQLIKVVTGKLPSSNYKHANIAEIEKLEIVAKTKISYSEKELLELMYEHLQAKGLTETAASLLTEGKLNDVAMESQQTQTIASGSISDLYSTQSRSQGFTKYSLDSTDSSGKIKGKWNRIRHSPVSQSPYHTHIGKLRKKMSRLPEKLPTLNTIMVDYLKEQHSFCETPVSVYPKFSLVEPHSCPEPKFRMNAPCNMTERLCRKEVFQPSGGIDGRRYDKQFIYSRFHPCRTLQSPDGIGFTCIEFPKFQYPSNNPTLILGSCLGYINFGLEVTKTKVNVTSFKCHHSPIMSFDLSKDSRMLLTTGAWGKPRSCLWRFENNFADMALQHGFQIDSAVYFGWTSDDKILGTRGPNAYIYDTSTLEEIVQLRPGVLLNNYDDNYATFDHTDTLVLSNAILWDARSRVMVHKFDKIGNENGFNGKFHPKGLHLLINNAMWDMRTFKLMNIIPDMAPCPEVMAYNFEGDILAGVTSPDSQSDNPAPRSHHFFRTFDPDDDYKTIASIDVKWGAISMDFDRSGRLLAMNQPLTDMATLPFESVCRVYEVGRPVNVDSDDELEDNFEETFEQRENIEEDSDD
ncbi:DDB1- and CUL4-associated factor 1-like [Glandiceps talaboti]